MTGVSLNFRPRSTGWIPLTPAPIWGHRDAETVFPGRGIQCGTVADGSAPVGAEVHGRRGSSRDADRVLKLAGQVLLSALAGTLCCLGYVGFGFWPLMLVGLVPLWAAFEDARPHGLGRAALLGFVFGFVAYAGGFHWMWRVVEVFLDGNIVLGAVLWLGDASWFGLRFALYGLVYASIRRRGWPLAMAGIPPLLVVEWLYPSLFPVHIGHALAPRLTLVQISDLGGPLLLSAFVALVNLAAFETWCWIRGRRRRPVLPWVTAVGAALVVWTYGTVRIAAIDAAAAAAPPLRVGLVQSNLGVFEKGRRPTFDHRVYLEQTRELLAAGDPVDLVVWPETVYTRGLRRPLPLSGRMIREDLGVPLLFGAASVDGTSGRNRTYNSALLIGADGVIRDAYDKNVLIPFTEYVPFVDLVPSLADGAVGASAFSAGTAMSALTLGPWRIAVPICHEAVQAAHVRRMVVAGRPNLLATVANDSWFGDSQEPWIHLAMARFRAIEHRRFLVRATNSGVSAVIDPVGRDVVRSGVLTRENLRATVNRLEVTTVYTNWGDWVGWLAAAVVAGALVRRRRPM